MNVWLEFLGAVVFIGMCVAAAVVLVNGDYDAAQHEALLDELWDGPAVTA